MYIITFIKKNKPQVLREKKRGDRAHTVPCPPLGLGHVVASVLGGLGPPLGRENVLASGHSENLLHALRAGLGHKRAHILERDFCW